MLCPSRMGGRWRRCAALLIAVESVLSKLRGTPLEDPVSVVGVVGGALLVAGLGYKLALLTQDWPSVCCWGWKSPGLPQRFN